MKIWIPHKFPSLNEYIDAERSHRMVAANMKKHWTNLVSQEVKLFLGTSFLPQEMMQFPRPVRFVIHEKDKRRDIDNVSSMVSKFCLDGMVKAGLLPNDSQKYINKIECDIVVDDKVGVEIWL